MSREEIIRKTVAAIYNLPEDRSEIIADFAEFISKKFEEEEGLVDAERE